MCRHNAVQPLPPAFGGKQSSVQHCNWECEHGYRRMRKQLSFGNVFISFELTFPPKPCLASYSEFLYNPWTVFSSYVHCIIFILQSTVSFIEWTYTGSFLQTDVQEGCVCLKQDSCHSGYTYFLLLPSILFSHQPCGLVPRPTGG